jgi:hypothetical protein
MRKDKKTKASFVGKGAFALLAKRFICRVVFLADMMLENYFC